MEDKGRRQFIKNSIATAGVTGFGLAPGGNAERRPREVWIAALTQHNIKGKDHWIHPFSKRILV